MRVAHLSDLHLGFRAYEATERGWNSRERDLAGAFRRTLQEVSRLDPALVIISGDVFDRPDPPSTAILAAVRGLSSLRAQLPRVPVLVVAGERDTPPSPADPGPVAMLDTVPGVEAAAGAPRAVRFRRTGVHALLVPHRSAAHPPFPEIRPDPDARWNVLVIRGWPRSSGAVPVNPGEWDYVAVGGPHDATSWAPNVQATGALERPGWNPWAETLEERGFTVFDLATGHGEFHPIAGRAVVDLAPVRVTAGDRDAGTRRLRELLHGVPGGVDGKLIRVLLMGDVSSPSEGVATSLLEAVRARAAHVEIELRGMDRTGSELELGSMEGVGDRASPQVLLVPSEGSDASGSGRAISLGRRGLTLVTSPSEALRVAAAAALGAESGDASARPRPLPGLGIRPDIPDDPGLRCLWAGHANPWILLQSLLGPRATDGEPAAKEPVAEPVTEESHDLGPSVELPGSEATAGMETELRDLRADSIEASGNLEARTLAWAQERQDAESNLQAYRSRARELQAQIRELESEGSQAGCPTCGQPLGENFGGLVRTLQNELEGVVQDGKWWKSRREQLDEKPEEMRALEARVLRLHAGIESVAERLQRARDGLGFSDEVGDEGGAAHPESGGKNGFVVSAADPRVREVLRDAGTLLGRVTQGALEGIRVTGTALGVVDREGRTRPAVGIEAAALRFAVHLALWERARSSGIRLGGLLLWEFHRTGSDESALPALELARELSQREVAVVVVAPPTVVGRMPELFRDVVELIPDASGRITSRHQSLELPSLGVRSTSRSVSRSEPS